VVTDEWHRRDAEYAEEVQRKYEEEAQIEFR
jgi:hypothetical protein